MSSTGTGFQAPKGTYDLVPPGAEAVLAVRAALLAAARRAGYSYLETPVFEETGLFARGVGASTDVVTKQMYTFADAAGRSLTLRPEGTAGVLRAVLQAGLHRGPLPVKVAYSGPFFRYEQPQAGRQRQFWQVGVEALGVSDPALDAEVVTVAADGFHDLGIHRLQLRVNSLGDATCRPAYRAALTAFLAGCDLDPATRRRAEINPLRVLDDKRPDVRAQLVAAPVIADFLCADCRAYHAEFLAALALVGVGCEADPRLVRGLDYYTRTTFEFAHPQLGAQAAVGGGGRYDGLSEELGGPALPGVGFGLGVDRTLLARQAETGQAADPARVAVFGVALVDRARDAVLATVAALRRAGVAADFCYGQRGLKGAMRAADRSGARLAILVGERDLSAGVAQLKELRSGEQQPVALAQLAATVQARLAEPEPNPAAKGERES